MVGTHSHSNTYTHTQTCQPYQRDSNFVKYYRFQNVCGERVCCVRLLFNIILDELFNMIEVVPKNKYVPIIYIHRRTHALTRTHTDSYPTVWLVLTYIWTFSLYHLVFPVVNALLPLSMPMPFAFLPTPHRTLISLSLSLTFALQPNRLLFEFWCFYLSRSLHFCNWKILSK